ncbi:MAG: ATP-binding cassette domain-containing protein [Dehalococcoidia bacterium]|nr:MAG: ATP-binding cassette domain-containing protein [Dehalococcoidia bacterium]
MQGTNLAIEVKGLVKEYPSKVLAVNGIDLNIKSNTIYALLGPNGAGKTTTINILTTLKEPTAGSIKVLGFDVIQQANKVRRNIGVTFQEMILDDELTGRQVLDYHGRLYKLGARERQKKVIELLKLAELEEAADRVVKTYSGGMKRRLELVRGLMTEPEILFLDEPTTGLDPQNRSSIWKYIRNLKEKSNLTLLLTTHYMEEAEELADYVGIIDYGKIVIEGTPRELIDKMGADTIQIAGNGNSDLFIQELKGHSFIQNIVNTNGLIQIGTDSGNKRLVEVVSIASKSGFTIEDISIAKPSLGDVFLKYTGRRLRDK